MTVVGVDPRVVRTVEIWAEAPRDQLTGALKVAMALNADLSTAADIRVQDTTVAAMGLQDLVATDLRNQRVPAGSSAAKVDMVIVDRVVKAAMAGMDKPDRVLPSMDLRVQAVGAEVRELWAVHLVAVIMDADMSLARGLPATGPQVMVQGSLWAPLASMDREWPVRMIVVFGIKRRMKCLPGLEMKRPKDVVSATGG